MNNPESRQHTIITTKINITKPFPSNESSCGGSCGGSCQSECSSTCGPSTCDTPGCGYLPRRRPGK